MMRWVCVNHVLETHFFGNPTPLANLSKPSSSSLLSSFQESLCKFSLKRWISAPGGIYESEMLLKGKRSQSLCINRPAAEPQGGESGRKLLVAEAPNPPPGCHLFPLSAHNPKQASPHLCDCTHCHFQEKSFSESILAFLWNRRNNSLNHRTERDDLITFIFETMKTQSGEVIWPAQAHTTRVV